MTIFNLVLKVLNFCIQTPNLLILGFNPLNIKLKSKLVKIWVTTMHIRNENGKFRFFLVKGVLGHFNQ